METVHSTKTKGYVTFPAGNGKIAIWFGVNESYKTEADAREAAELLKAFFEAKEAGKVVELVMYNEKPEYCNDGGAQCTLHPNECWSRCIHSKQRPGNTVISQMNAAKPNGPTFEKFADLCKDEPMKAAQPNGDALKEFADVCKDDAGEKIAGVIWGKRANDMTVEQYTAFTIAHNATQIFAHGGYTSHAAAVDDAAEIWRLAQRIEL